jgi:signal transduction histidine kinase
MSKLASTHIVDQTHGTFYEAYCLLLHAFLSGDGEEALSQSYELGRQAMLSGLGLIDLIELHHMALDALGPLPPEDAVSLTRGALVFLEECLSPFELTHRGYRDAVGLAHDMTRFTSVACHEIKAPLSAVMSSAGMLREILDVKSDSPEGRLIANVLDGAAILNSRTNEMMDLAGLYAGLFRAEPRPVDTAQFLHRAIDRLGPEALRHGIQLRLEIAGDLPYAEFDPDRIQQVITNLTQNAIKYAADGDKIIIQADADGETLTLRVNDYGHGLSAERLRWLSSDASTQNHDKRANGSGLGLMLCKQIMQAHHGQLTARNRAGKGATFEITLPVSQRAVHKVSP